MCAITFRLPSVSALCSRTSRVVSLALSPDHHTVMVDVPRGRDPKSPSDVRRHVEKDDSVFYELPVSVLGKRWRGEGEKGWGGRLVDNIW